MAKRSTVKNVLIDRLLRLPSGELDKEDWRYVLLHRFYDEHMRREFHGDELEDVAMYVSAVVARRLAPPLQDTSISPAPPRALSSLQMEEDAARRAKGPP